MLTTVRRQLQTGLPLPTTKDIVRFKHERFDAVFSITEKTVKTCMQK